MAAMLGESYTTAVTTLKQRVGLLTSQYNTTIERMDKAIEYVTSAEKTIDGMIKRIEAIEDQLKGTEAQHAENKKVVDDVKAKLADIDKKADKVMDSLANSATILRAMEEAGEAVKENKADEGQEEPDKSGDTDVQSAEPADDGKRKGKRVSRKDADAKIIKAIAKKAKKNPNIK
jgi:cysteinyl-tRNA synthetase